MFLMGEQGDVPDGNVEEDLLYGGVNQSQNHDRSSCQFIRPLFSRFSRINGVVKSTRALSSLARSLITKVFNHSKLEYQHVPKNLAHWDSRRHCESKGTTDFDSGIFTDI